MSFEPNVSVERDRLFCEALLPGVSRTFALSISLLPRELRESVGTAYLLCRVVDCIEDHRTIAAAARNALFDEFDALMKDDLRDPASFERDASSTNMGDSNEERELVRGAGAVFRRFRALSAGEREAIRPHVLEMSAGMREYAGREGLDRIADLEDLDRYCYFVAGTVGKLLTALFARNTGIEPTDELRAQAVRFGLGLQLVNIAKDVADDATRGVSYVPRSVARARGIEVTQMLEPQHRAAALAALSAICDHAAAHLIEAEKYTLAWQGDKASHVRLFCAVPLALAFETLAMTRAGTDALTPGKTPKVSREGVAAIVRDATNGSHSNTALTALFRRSRGEGASVRRVLETTMRKGSAYLLGQQEKEGFWKGELETNVTMDAEDLLLRQFLGIRTDEVTQKAANWIRSKQREDGSWANAKNGPTDLSTTVEAYVALKLAGDSIDAPHMLKTAALIRSMGGVPATRVFTRVWLALFGLWDWKDLPILPPEMNLLPSWFPLNPYDFACWARQTVVALSVVMTYRPVRPIGFDIDELYGERIVAAPEPTLRGRAFKAIDRALRVYSKRPAKRLRERALREAERWIVQRQEADGSWGGIQPPWVYSLMALHLRGYPLDHPVMRVGLEGLDRFTIVEGPIRRLEACQSPVWDTCLALQALADAGVPRTDPRMVRAVEWILKNEVRIKGDWSVRRPDLPPGGWAFEFANVNYPDIDDTAEVILGLRAVVHPDPARVESAITRAVRWTLGMQSKDGGWGAFDADNTQALCRDIPFCDFGEVIDDPSADVTAHVVEMLCKEGMADHPATRAGVEWLLAHQEKDGSWFGRWGVNYVYGTGAVLVALIEAGIDHEAKSVRRGVEWLYAHQNADGGWGEDVRSYEDDAWRGRGDSTPSQTAWALLGLVAAGESDPRVDRAIEYLAREQREDGRWDEDQYTGTGFPGDFYINYHLYRQIFPVMALGRVARMLGIVVESRRGKVDVPLYELTKERDTVEAE